MMKPFIYVMMGIKSDVKSKMDRSGINGTLGLSLSAESLMVLFMPAVSPRTGEVFRSGLNYFRV